MNKTRRAPGKNRTVMTTTRAKITTTLTTTVTTNLVYGTTKTTRKDDNYDGNDEVMDNDDDDDDDYHGSIPGLESISSSQFFFFRFFYNFVFFELTSFSPISFLSLDPFWKRTFDQKKKIKEPSWIFYVTFYMRHVLMRFLVARS